MYTIYGCNYPSGSGSCTGVTNVAPVETAPLGAGSWGQQNLAGSLWEWNLNRYARYVDPCTDCANLTAASTRGVRGGDFNTGTSFLATAFRNGNNPADKGAYTYGIRCARTP